MFGFILPNYVGLEYKLLFVDVVQDLLSMDFGLDILWSEDFLDNAFFIYEVSGAENADGLSATSNLLAPTTEFLQ